MKNLSDVKWNEAIYRVIHIPKTQQTTLTLSPPEIFLCTLEFYKLYHEYYGFNIEYFVYLLEFMKNNPERYKAEWDLWRNAIQKLDELIK